MKVFLASSAIAIACAVSPAYAQQPQKASPPVTADSSTEGAVRVEGVAPSKVLGAIDTEKLTKEGSTDATASAQVADQQPPENKESVTVDTKVQQRADATVETKTETITPVSGRPALNPDNPIAPEVQAVVDKKKRYTTADIVAAQLEAIRNTPPVEATTTITTTTTTPAPG